MDWARLDNEVRNAQSEDRAGNVKGKYRHLLTAVDALLDGINPKDIPTIYEDGVGYDKGTLSSFMYGYVQRACTFFETVKPQLDEHPATLTKTRREELEQIKPVVSRELEELVAYEKANKDLLDKEKELKALTQAHEALRLRVEDLKQLESESKVLKLRDEQLKADIAQLEKEITSTKDDISDALRKFERLKSAHMRNLKDLEDMNNRYSNENEILYDEIVKKRNEYTQGNSEVDGLISELLEKLQRAKDVKARLSK